MPLSVWWLCRKVGYNLENKVFLVWAGFHTEAISPVAISPSNNAIYHLWTKQIHLYRTSHTGAIRYPIRDVLLYCLVTYQQSILLQCESRLMSIFDFLRMNGSAMQNFWSICNRNFWFKDIHLPCYIQKMRIFYQLPDFLTTIWTFKLNFSQFVKFGHNRFCHCGIDFKLLQIF